MPTLLFLPNLTPIDESIRLQKPAYKALYTLADTRYPQENGKTPDQKMKFYFKIMRHGILQAYAHSHEHPRIVEVLLNQIQTLVARMQIHAVKQLKVSREVLETLLNSLQKKPAGLTIFFQDLIPIFSSVLTDPFGVSVPSLLLSATKALQITILNCWPRISEKTHRIEVIKAIALCWNTVNEKSNDNVDETEDRIKELDEVKNGLKLSGRLLVKAVEGRFDIKAELQPLLRADPTLVSVFEVEIRPENSE